MLRGFPLIHQLESARGESRVEPATEARSDGTPTPKRVGSRPRSGTQDDMPRGGTSASSSRPRRTWPKSTRRDARRLHRLRGAGEGPALRREERLRRCQASETTSCATIACMASADYLSCWTPPPDLPSRIRSAVRAVLFAREPDIHPQLRDRVLKEVLWFATEVPRKYATRYRSVAAWELQRKGKRVGEWVGLVAHEHVWTRATCRIRLLSAPDATAIEAILSALQGCVVTKAEHQRLKPFDATHEGWARYIAAGVPVIDTSTGNQADLSALEVGSD
jgi:hypothetical protein